MLGRSSGLTVFGVVSPLLLFVTGRPLTPRIGWGQFKLLSPLSGRRRLNKGPIVRIGKSGFIVNTRFSPRQIYPLVIIGFIQLNLTFPIVWQW